MFYKLVCLTCLSVFLFSSPTVAKTKDYVGVERCARCHSDPPASIVPNWRTRPHARAFATLQTAKARRIALKMGIKSPDTSNSCLICHLTSVGQQKRSSGRGISLDEGVNCEACHGPGKRYAKFSVMNKIALLRTRIPQKAAEQALKVGLLLQRGKSCERCHVPSVYFRGKIRLNPTFTSFDLKSAMLKIRHWK